jgi:hypothetical protein
VLVRDLQRLLENLYGIELDADVRDYLVTDAGTLGRWEQPGARDTEEKLLIEERDGEVGLALYLDEALLARLDALDPRESLCGRNLADFCLALEGVSHFNYVAWNAALDKTVTLLELEMQAEVDKYLGARVLLARQQGGDIEADGLIGLLFDEPGFDAALAPAELDRYRDAASLAGRYCRSLQSRFPGGSPGQAMLRELRAFFRWPQPAKVSHIRSTVLS